MASDSWASTGLAVGPARIASSQTLGYSLIRSRRLKIHLRLLRKRICLNPASQHSLSLQARMRGQKSQQRPRQHQLYLPLHRLVMISPEQWIKKQREPMWNTWAARPSRMRQHEMRSYLACDVMDINPLFYWTRLYVFSWYCYLLSSAGEWSRFGL